jgi:hypothetical protein
MKYLIVVVYTVFLFDCYNSKDKSEIPSLLPLLTNKQIGILMLGDSLLRDQILLVCKIN